MRSILKTPLLRFVSATTLFVFLVTDILWAVPPGGITFFPTRETPSFLEIQIPSELASIEEIYEAPAQADPNLVVHIQNIHGHYEAQSQIKKLLGYLYEKYGFKLLFVEGAAQALDREYLELFEKPERNLALADRLTREGQLNGVEYYLMDSPEEVRAVGIEDAKLYRQNYEDFKEVHQAKNKTHTFLQSLEQNLEGLSSRIFSQETRRLLSEWRKFEAGHRDFLPYVKRLSEEAKRVLGLDLGSLFSQVEWPQLTRILVLQEMEKDLDFKAAEKEKAQVIEFLKEKRISQEIIEAIESLEERRITLAESEEVRKLKDTPRYLFEKLAGEAAPKGFYFHQYPAFSLWAGHIILKNELDSQGLFKEINKIFEKILNELAVTEKEQNLLELYRDANLLEKLLNLKLTREEWKQTTYRSEWLKPEVMQSRIKKLTIPSPSGRGQGEGRNPHPPAEAGTFSQREKGIEPIYTTAQNFYEIARKREDVFYETLSKEMKASGEQKAVLVTGGFHTEGMLEKLREEKISYSVLMPKLRGADLDQSNYIETMLETKPTMFDVGTIEYIGLLQNAMMRYEQGLYKPEEKGKLIAEIEDLTQELKHVLQAFVEIGIYETWEEAAEAFNYFNLTKYSGNRKVRLKYKDRILNIEVNGKSLTKYYEDEDGKLQAHLLDIEVSPDKDGKIRAKAHFKKGKAADSKSESRTERSSVQRKERDSIRPTRSESRAVSGIQIQKIRETLTHLLEAEGNINVIGVLVAPWRGSDELQIHLILEEGTFLGVGAPEDTVLQFQLMSRLDFIKSGYLSGIFALKDPNDLKNPSSALDQAAQVLLVPQRDPWGRAVKQDVENMQTPIENWVVVGKDEATEQRAREAILASMDRVQTLQKAEESLPYNAFLEELVGKDIDSLIEMAREADEPYHSLHAIAELGKRGKKAQAAVPFLADILKHRNPGFRDEAVIALSQIATESPEVLKQLVQVLTDEDQDAKIRFGIARVLGHMGEPALSTVPTLINMLVGSSDINRTHAISALIELAQKGYAIPQLIELLSHPYPRARMRAAYILGEAGESASVAVPDLVKATRDLDLGVARDAIKALGKMGDKAESATPDLIALLKGPSDAMRSEALEAINEIGEKAQVPSLYALLEGDWQKEGYSEIVYNMLGALIRSAKKGRIWFSLAGFSMTRKKFLLTRRVEGSYEDAFSDALQLYPKVEAILIGEKEGTYKVARIENAAELAGYSVRVLTYRREDDSPETWSQHYLRRMAVIIKETLMGETIKGALVPIAEYDSLSLRGPVPATQLLTTLGLIPDASVLDAKSEGELDLTELLLGPEFRFASEGIRVRNRRQKGKITQEVVISLEGGEEGVWIRFRDAQINFKGPVTGGTVEELGSVSFHPDILFEILDKNTIKLTVNGETYIAGSDGTFEKLGRSESRTAESAVQRKERDSVGPVRSESRSGEDLFNAYHWQLLFAPLDVPVTVTDTREGIMFGLRGETLQLHHKRSQYDNPQLLNFHRRITRLSELAKDSYLGKSRLWDGLFFFAGLPLIGAGVVVWLLSMSPSILFNTTPVIPILLVVVLFLILGRIFYSESDIYSKQEGYLGDYIRHGLLSFLFGTYREKASQITEDYIREHGVKLAKISKAEVDSEELVSLQDPDIQEILFLLLEARIPEVLVSRFLALLTTESREEIQSYRKALRFERAWIRNPKATQVFQGFSEEQVAKMFFGMHETKQGILSMIQKIENSIDENESLLFLQAFHDYLKSFSGPLFDFTQYEETEIIRLFLQKAETDKEKERLQGILHEAAAFSDIIEATTARIQKRIQNHTSGELVTADIELPRVTGRFVDPIHIFGMIELFLKVRYSSESTAGVFLEWMEDGLIFDKKAILLKILGTDLQSVAEVIQDGGETTDIFVENMNASIENIDALRTDQAVFLEDRASNPKIQMDAALQVLKTQDSLLREAMLVRLLYASGFSRFPETMPQIFGEELPRAIPFLMEALSDSEPGIRDKAAYTLHFLGNQYGEDMQNAIPQLNQNLFHDNPKVRRSAAKALGAIPPHLHESTAALDNAANDPDKEVRAAVKEALQNITTKKSEKSESRTEAGEDEESVEMEVSLWNEMFEALEIDAFAKSRNQVGVQIEWKSEPSQAEKVISDYSHPEAFLELFEQFYDLAALAEDDTGTQQEFFHLLIFIFSLPLMLAVLTGQLLSMGLGESVTESFAFNFLVSFLRMTVFFTTLFIGFLFYPQVNTQGNLRTYVKHRLLRYFFGSYRQKAIQLLENYSAQYGEAVLKASDAASFQARVAVDSIAKVTKYETLFLQARDRTLEEFSLREEDGSVTSYKVQKIEDSSTAYLIYAINQKTNESEVVKILKDGVEFSDFYDSSEALSMRRILEKPHPHILSGRVLYDDSQVPVVVRPEIQNPKAIEDFSMEDRVKIFLQIAQAVQHSHTQLNIANLDLIFGDTVLVTEREGEPFVHLIDFQKAKLLGLAGPHRDIQDVHALRDFLLYEDPIQEEAQSRQVPEGLEAFMDWYERHVQAHEAASKTPPLRPVIERLEAALQQRSEAREKDELKAARWNELIQTLELNASASSVDSKTLRLQLRGTSPRSVRVKHTDSHQYELHLLYQELEKLAFLQKESSPIKKGLQFFAELALGISVGLTLLVQWILFKFASESPSSAVLIVFGILTLVVGFLVALLFDDTSDAENLYQGYRPLYLKHGLLSRFFGSYQEQARQLFEDYMKTYGKTVTEPTEQAMTYEAILRQAENGTLKEFSLREEGDSITFYKVMKIVEVRSAWLIYVINQNTDKPEAIKVLNKHQSEMPVFLSSGEHLFVNRIKDNPHPHILNGRLLYTGGDQEIPVVVRPWLQDTIFAADYPSEGKPKIFLQILKAIQHLHEELEIAHMDLNNTENLLVIDRDGEPWVQIIDFGGAFDLSSVGPERDQDEGHGLRHSLLYEEQTDEGAQTKQPLAGFEDFVAWYEEYMKVREGTSEALLGPVIERLEATLQQRSESRTAESATQRKERNSVGPTRSESRSDMEEFSEEILDIVRVGMDQKVIYKLQDTLREIRQARINPVLIGRLGSLIERLIEIRNRLAGKFNRVLEFSASESISLENDLAVLNEILEDLGDISEKLNPASYRLATRAAKSNLEAAKKRIVDLISKYSELLSTVRDRQTVTPYETVVTPQIIQMIPAQTTKPERSRLWMTLTLVALILNVAGLITALVIKLFFSEKSKETPLDFVGFGHVAATGDVSKMVVFIKRYLDSVGFELNPLVSELAQKAVIHFASFYTVRFNGVSNPEPGRAVQLLWDNAFAEMKAELETFKGYWISRKGVRTPVPTKMLKSSEAVVRKAGFGEAHYHKVASTGDVHAMAAYVEKVANKLSLKITDQDHAVWFATWYTLPRKGVHNPLKGKALQSYRRLVQELRGLAQNKEWITPRSESRSDMEEFSKEVLDIVQVGIGVKVVQKLDSVLEKMRNAHFNLHNRLGIESLNNQLVGVGNRLAEKFNSILQSTVSEPISLDDDLDALNKIRESLGRAVERFEGTPYQEEVQEAEENLEAVKQSIEALIRKHASLLSSVRGQETITVSGQTQVMPKSIRKPKPKTTKPKRSRLWIGIVLAALILGVAGLIAGLVIRLFFWDEYELKADARDPNKKWITSRSEGRVEIPFEMTEEIRFEGQATFQFSESLRASPKISLKPSGISYWIIDQEDSFEIVTREDSPDKGIRDISGTPLARILFDLGQNPALEKLGKNNMPSTSRVKGWSQLWELEITVQLKYTDQYVYLFLNDLLSPSFRISRTNEPGSIEAFQGKDQWSLLKIGVPEDVAQIKQVHALMTIYFLSQSRQTQKAFFELATIEKLIEKLPSEITDTSKSESRTAKSAAQRKEKILVGPTRSESRTEQSSVQGEERDSVGPTRSESRIQQPAVLHSHQIEELFLEDPDGFFEKAFEALEAYPTHPYSQKETVSDNVIRWQASNNAPGALLELRDVEEIIMIGDRHSAYMHLSEPLRELKIASILEKNPKAHLILLGDGIHALGNVINLEASNAFSFNDFLLAVRLKTMFPLQVHLLPGNHEYAHVPARYGGTPAYRGRINLGPHFENMLFGKGNRYPGSAMTDFADFVRDLPVAVLIRSPNNFTVFASHSGVAPSLRNIQPNNHQALVDLVLHRNFEFLRTDEIDKEPFRELMWARPFQEGSTVIRDFRLALGADLLVGGHTAIHNISLEEYPLIQRVPIPDAKGAYVGWTGQENGLLILDAVRHPAYFYLDLRKIKGPVKHVADLLRPKGKKNANRVLGSGSKSDFWEHVPDVISLAGTPIFVLGYSRGRKLYLGTPEMKGKYRLVAEHGSSLTVGKENGYRAFLSIEGNSAMEERHIEFQYVTSRGWQVKDLGSASGTWLNGERLSDAGEESEWFPIRTIGIRDSKSESRSESLPQFSRELMVWEDPEDVTDYGFREAFFGALKTAFDYLQKDLTVVRERDLKELQDRILNMPGFGSGGVPKQVQVRISKDNPGVVSSGAEAIYLDEAGYHDETRLSITIPHTEVAKFKVLEPEFLLELILVSLGIPNILWKWPAFTLEEQTLYQETKVPGTEIRYNVGFGSLRELSSALVDNSKPPFHLNETLQKEWQGKSIEIKGQEWLGVDIKEPFAIRTASGVRYYGVENGRVYDYELGRGLVKTKHSKRNDSLRESGYQIVLETDGALSIENSSSDPISVEPIGAHYQILLDGTMIIDLPIPGKGRFTFQGNSLQLDERLLELTGSSEYSFFHDRSALTYTPQGTHERQVAGVRDPGAMVEVLTAFLSSNPTSRRFQPGLVEWVGFEGSDKHEKLQDALYANLRLAYRYLKRPLPSAYSYATREYQRLALQVPGPGSGGLPAGIVVRLEPHLEKSIRSIYRKETGKLEISFKKASFLRKIEPLALISIVLNSVLGHDTFFDFRTFVLLPFSAPETSTLEVPHSGESYLFDLNAMANLSVALNDEGDRESPSASTQPLLPDSLVKVGPFASWKGPLTQVFEIQVGGRSDFYDISGNQEVVPYELGVGPDPYSVPSSRMVLDDYEVGRNLQRHVVIQNRTEEPLGVKLIQDYYAFVPDKELVVVDIKTAAAKRFTFSGKLEDLKDALKSLGHGEVRFYKKHNGFSYKLFGHRSWKFVSFSDKAAMIVAIRKILARPSSSEARSHRLRDEQIEFERGFLPHQAISLKPNISAAYRALMKPLPADVDQVAEKSRILQGLILPNFLKEDDRVTVALEASPSNSARAQLVQDEPFPRNLNLSVSSIDPISSRFLLAMMVFTFALPNEIFNWESLDAAKAPKTTLKMNGGHFSKADLIRLYEDLAEQAKLPAETLDPVQKEAVEVESTLKIRESLQEEPIPALTKLRFPMTATPFLLNRESQPASVFVAEGSQIFPYKIAEGAGTKGRSQHDFEGYSVSTNGHFIEVNNTSSKKLLYLRPLGDTASIREGELVVDFSTEDGRIQFKAALEDLEDRLRNELGLDVVVAVGENVKQITYRNPNQQDQWLSVSLLNSAQLTDFFKKFARSEGRVVFSRELLEWSDVDGVASPGFRQAFYNALKIAFDYLQKDLTVVRRDDLTALHETILQMPGFGRQGIPPKIYVNIARGDDLDIGRGIESIYDGTILTITLPAEETRHSDMLKPEVLLELLVLSLGFPNTPWTGPSPQAPPFWETQEPKRVPGTEIRYAVNSDLLKELSRALVSNSRETLRQTEASEKPWEGEPIEIKSQESIGVSLEEPFAIRSASGVRYYKVENARIYDYEIGHGVVQPKYSKRHDSLREADYQILVGIDGTLLIVNESSEPISVEPLEAHYQFLDGAMVIDLPIPGQERFTFQGDPIALDEALLRRTGNHEYRVYSKLSQFRYSKRPGSGSTVANFSNNDEMMGALTSFLALHPKPSQFHPDLIEWVGFDEEQDELDEPGDYRERFFSSMRSVYRTLKRPLRSSSKSKGAEYQKIALQIPGPDSEGLPQKIVVELDEGLVSHMLSRYDSKTGELRISIRDAGDLDLFSFTNKTPLHFWLVSVLGYDDTFYWDGTSHLEPLNSSRLEVHDRTVPHSGETYSFDAATIGLLPNGLVLAGIGESAEVLHDPLKSDSLLKIGPFASWKSDFAGIFEVRVGDRRDYFHSNGREIKPYQLGVGPDPYSQSVNVISAADYGIRTGFGGKGTLQNKTEATISVRKIGDHYSFNPNKKLMVVDMAMDRFSMQRFTFSGSLKEFGEKLETSSRGEAQLYEKYNGFSYRLEGQGEWTFVSFSDKEAIIRAIRLLDLQSSRSEAREGLNDELVNWMGFEGVELIKREAFFEQLSFAYQDLAKPLKDASEGLKGLQNKLWNVPGYSSKSLPQSIVIRLDKTLDHEVESIFNSEDFSLEITVQSEAVFEKLNEKFLLELWIYSLGFFDKAVRWEEIKVGVPYFSPYAHIMPTTLELLPVNKEDYDKLRGLLYEQGLGEGVSYYFADEGTIEIELPIEGQELFSYQGDLQGFEDALRARNPGNQDFYVYIQGQQFLYKPEGEGTFTYVSLSDRRAIVQAVQYLLSRSESRTHLTPDRLQWNDRDALANEAFREEFYEALKRAFEYLRKELTIVERSDLKTLQAMILGVLDDKSNGIPHKIVVTILKDDPELEGFPTTAFYSSEGSETQLSITIPEKDLEFPLTTLTEFLLELLITSIGASRNLDAAHLNELAAILFTNGHSRPPAPKVQVKVWEGEPLSIAPYEGLLVELNGPFGIRSEKGIRYFEIKDGILHDYQLGKGRAQAQTGTLRRRPEQFSEDSYTISIQSSGALLISSYSSKPLQVEPLGDHYSFHQEGGMVMDLPIPGKGRFLFRGSPKELDVALFDHGVEGYVVDLRRNQLHDVPNDVKASFTDSENMTKMIVSLLSRDRPRFRQELMEWAGFSEEDEDIVLQEAFYLKLRQAYRYLKKPWSFASERTLEDLKSLALRVPGAGSRGLPQKMVIILDETLEPNISARYERDSGRLEIRIKDRLVMKSMTSETLLSLWVSAVLEVEDASGRSASLVSALIENGERVGQFIPNTTLGDRLFKVDPFGAVRTKSRVPFEVRVGQKRHFFVLTGNYLYEYQLGNGIDSEGSKFISSEDFEVIVDSSGSIQIRNRTEETMAVRQLADHYSFIPDKDLMMVDIHNPGRNRFTFFGTSKELEAQLPWASRDETFLFGEGVLSYQPEHSEVLIEVLFSDKDEMIQAIRFLISRSESRTKPSLAPSYSFHPETGMKIHFSLSQKDPFVFHGDPSELDEALQVFDIKPVYSIDLNQRTLSYKSVEAEAFRVASFSNESQMVEALQFLLKGSRRRRAFEPNVLEWQGFNEGEYDPHGEDEQLQQTVYEGLRTAYRFLKKGLPLSYKNDDLRKWQKRLLMIPGLESQGLPIKIRVRLDETLDGRLESVYWSDSGELEISVKNREVLKRIKRKVWLDLWIFSMAGYDHRMVWHSFKERPQFPKRLKTQSLKIPGTEEPYRFDAKTFQQLRSVLSDRGNQSRTLVIHEEKLNRSIRLPPFMSLETRTRAPFEVRANKQSRFFVYDEGHYVDYGLGEGPSHDPTPIYPIAEEAYEIILMMSPKSVQIRNRSEKPIFIRPLESYYSFIAKKKMIVVDLSLPEGMRFTFSGSPGKLQTLLRQMSGDKTLSLSGSVLSYSSPHSTTRTYVPLSNSDEMIQVIRSIVSRSEGRSQVRLGRTDLRKATGFSALLKVISLSWGVASNFLKTPVAQAAVLQEYASALSSVQVTDTLRAAAAAYQASNLLVRDERIGFVEMVTSEEITKQTLNELAAILRAKTQRYFTIVVDQGNEAQVKEWLKVVRKNVDLSGNEIGERLDVVFLNNKKRLREIPAEIYARAVRGNAVKNQQEFYKHFVQLSVGLNRSEVREVAVNLRDLSMGAQAWLARSEAGSRITGSFVALELAGAGSADQLDLRTSRALKEEDHRFYQMLEALFNELDSFLETDLEATKKFLRAA